MSKKHYMVAAVMMLGVAGVPIAAHAATSEGSTTPPSVMAFNQSAGSKSIVVDYAYLPENGYVAVYKSDEAGKPTGEPIGYTQAKQGDHRQFEIELKEAPAKGDRLWVALYKDADQDPSFKPGAGDKPVWSKSDLPAENMFELK